MNHSQLSAIFKVAAHNSREPLQNNGCCSEHTFLGKEFPALHAGLLRGLIKDGLKFEPKLKTRELETFRNAFSVLNALRRPAKQPLTVLCVTDVGAIFQGVAIALLTFHH